MSGLYRLDRIGWIVLAGSYWLDHIGCIVLSGSHQYWSLSLLGETGFYALDDLLLSGWDRWTGWYVGGTGVRWRDRH